MACAEKEEQEGQGEEIDGARAVRARIGVGMQVDQEASPHWLRKAAHDPNHRRSFGERRYGSSRRLATSTPSTPCTGPVS